MIALEQFGLGPRGSQDPEEVASSLGDSAGGQEAIVWWVWQGLVNKGYARGCCSVPSVGVDG